MLLIIDYLKNGVGGMQKNLLYQGIILSFLMVLVVLLCPNPAFAEKSLADVEKNVVRVVAKDATGEILGWCSGFVLGVEEPYEYIISNWHRLNPESYDVNRLDVFIMVSASDLVPARVFHHLAEPDIAILKVDPEHHLYGFNPLEFANRNIANTGETIYNLGFIFNEGDDWQVSLSSDKTSIKGNLTEFTRWDGVEVYRTNAAVDSGTTGGPLVNENGQVLGVNSFTMLYLTGINGAVQIDYLNDFLLSRNIPFNAASEINSTNGDNGEDGESETNYLLIGGIIAGLLVLGAIIMVSTMAGRRRKPPAKSSAKPSQKDAAAPIRDDKTPAASASDAWARTQAVFPQKAKRKDTPVVEKSGIKDVRPLLLGIAGQFTGKTIDFVEGQIVVGRDPRLAQMIYPQNNTDISRKHCTVRFDEKTYKFILEDFSSNGTFLSSNQKLEPGKPYYLSSGDRFYLAKPSEVFEVKLEVQ
jgi:hypothetical protein